MLVNNLPKQANLLLITSQDWGGAQLYVFELAKEMKQRDMPVIVCAGAAIRRSPHVPIVSSADAGRETNNAGRELGIKCREENIDFIELKYMARDIKPLANLLSLFELIGLFRRLKPRAVHLNSTMMGVVGSLAATVTGVPRRLYCIGGWVFNEDIPKWKKKFYIWAERISAAWKDVITLVHPGDESLAIKLKIKPQKKLVTIPNGIDVPDFESKLMSRERAREILKIDLEAKIVGTIANAYPPKNLLWYLDVCKQAHNADRRIFFVIMGDGPLFDELKQKRDTLGAQDFIMFTGRRMDAPMMYKAFDLFVLPSSKEGMPITLLEAMAAKTPIIATDVGAAKWMLAPCAGVIVQPGDKNALAQEILNLIHDKARKTNLAESAYKSVSQRFSWKETVNKTLELFE